MPITVFEESKNVMWALGLLLFLFLSSIFYTAYKSSTQPPPPPSPCSEYANTSLQDVPARCVKYFTEK